MPAPSSEHVSAFAIWRQFLLSFLIVGLAFAGIVAVIYRLDVLHQQALLEKEARHILELQQELLLFELGAVESDLLYLATQDKLRTFLSGDDSARGNLELDYVNFALAKTVYDQIRCLDTTGQEIVRVNYRDGDADVVTQDQLQSKANRYYYQQSLSLDAGDVYISPFDLNVEHGRIQRPIRPVIRFITPVFDDSGQKRGLLVLNYVGAHLLSKLKQVSTGFRGETMLLNTLGEYLQAPDRNHEWGWLLDHDQSFCRDFPAAWDYVKRLGAGEFRRDEQLYSFRQMSLGRGSRINRLGSSNGLADQNLNSLILISYVSSAVATAHSKALLNRLMVMYIGVMVVASVLALYRARSLEIRKNHERQLLESEARLRILSSKLLAVQETERRRLSHDLHDELGQQVTAISLDLRSLAKENASSHQSALLRRAIDATDQLLKCLHEIATRVRPSVLDDLGLHDAVESFLAEYQDRTGVTVTSQLHIDRESIPPAIGENAYRILQEALANVAAHAQAAEAEVIIESNDEVLRMTVQDRGVGFDPAELANSARLGILGMSERVELLNGQFELEARPGGGTRIQISIPLGENKRTTPLESANP